LSEQNVMNISLCSEDVLHDHEYINEIEQAVKSNERLAQRFYELELEVYLPDPKAAIERIYGALSYYDKIRITYHHRLSSPELAARYAVPEGHLCSITIDTYATVLLGTLENKALRLLRRNLMQTTLGHTVMAEFMRVAYSHTSLASKFEYLRGGYTDILLFLKHLKYKGVEQQITVTQPIASEEDLFA
jgi:hypothetical protein